MKVCSMTLGSIGFATAAIAVALSAVVTSAVATSAAAQGSDMMGECKKMTAAYLEAYNKGDAATLAAMYAKEAEFSGPFWTAAGHDAIAQGIKAELAGGTKYTQIGCTRSVKVGQVGYADGPWEAMAKGPDGKDMKVGGHYAVVVKPDHGKYLFISHFANLQLPPPGAPTH